MSNELKDTIFQLRDEIGQLKAEALAKTGDKRARWQRAQEIKAQQPELEQQASRLRPSERAGLDKALAQISGGLIFLLAASNRPDDLPGEGESTEAAVRRIYNQALQIAGDFALERGDRAALRLQADELRQELAALAKGGANQNPDWQRMLSDANLDLAYVTSGGLRPHSTRLAYYLSDQRKAGGAGR
jgi:hypothetical protein